MNHRKVTFVFLLSCAVSLIASIGLPAHGDENYKLRVTEQDGSPVAYSVKQIKVPNGSLTDNAGGTVSIAFAGNGAGFTNLNASNLASGTVADARLSANVTLGGNTFSGTGSVVRATSPALVTPTLGVASATSVAIGSGGAAITGHLSATATWNPASVADDAMTSTTVTVTGAAVGDTVTVGFSQAVPAGALLAGAVTATNTVTVTLFNKTGGALDLASGTLRADAWQH
jgi:hypothetical protein